VECLAAPAPSTAPYGVFNGSPDSTYLLITGHTTEGRVLLPQGAENDPSLVLAESLVGRRINFWPDVPLETDGRGGAVDGLLLVALTLFERTWDRELLRLVLRNHPLCLGCFERVGLFNVTRGTADSPLWSIF
jgi:hypothetical protein